MEFTFFWLYPSRRRQVFYLRNVSTIFFAPIMFFMFFIMFSNYVLIIIFRENHINGMPQDYGRNDISLLSYCSGKLISKS